MQSIQLNLARGLAARAAALKESSKALATQNVRFEPPPLLGRHQSSHSGRRHRRQKSSGTASNDSEGEIEEEHEIDLVIVDDVFGGDFGFEGDEDYENEDDDDDDEDDDDDDDDNSDVGAGVGLLNAVLASRKPNNHNV